MGDKLLEQIAEDVVKETMDDFKAEVRKDTADAVADSVSEETPITPYCLEEDLAKVEQLTREIDLLSQKEKILTKKLSLAKDKGLHEQADRCRILLQRLVIHRNRKKAELAEAEARIEKAQAVAFMERFAKEVDELTLDFEDNLLDLGPKPKKVDQEPLFVAEYDHKAKSKRLSRAALLYFWIGTLIGLIGAVAFMLLVHFEHCAFSWWILSAFGAVIAVGFVLSLILRAVSKRYARLAEAIEQEIAERKAEYEAELQEYERMLELARKISQAEYYPDIAEAYAIEKDGDQRRVKMKKLQAWVPDLSDPEKLKRALKIALPIVATGTALTLALSSAKKKKKAEKQQSEKHPATILDLCCEVVKRLS